MSTAETPYEAIGGDAGVRALVDQFYAHMDTLPSASAIRAMHPKDIQPSKDKLYEFLSGWLGGPPLYVEKRGHPRLRRRHMPFPINQDAADQWMACMKLALDETELNDMRREFLMQRFTQTANFMCNVGD